MKQACIESAAETAVQNGLRSYKSFCRLVEAKSSRMARPKAPSAQDHELIRPSSDYGAFFDQFAAKNEVVLSRENLPQVWQNADWLKVIDVFGLETQKQGKGDEVWLRSPFTGEEKASLHVHLKQNIFKDFSSGKGGGILNFCQDLLGHQGRSMNCYQVASWMLENGISELSQAARPIAPKLRQNAPKINKPVKADLRPFFQNGHAALEQRGSLQKPVDIWAAGICRKVRPGQDPH